FPSPCPVCWASSIAASRARSAGDNPSRAAASAPSGSAWSPFGSLVQAGVQAPEALAASPLGFSLAPGVPLLDTLGVTGSSPVAPTSLPNHFHHSLALKCQELAASGLAVTLRYNETPVPQECLSGHSCVAVWQTGWFPRARVPGDQVSVKPRG